MKTGIIKTALKLKHPQIRISLSVFIPLVLSILYSAYNVILGIWSSSAWFIAMGTYYFFLSVIRSFLAYHMGKKEKSGRKSLFVMKTDGILLIVLTIILSGVIYFTIEQQIAKAYTEIVMISIATYTFYKMTLAIINLVKAKKRKSLLLLTLRNIGFAEMLASMLSLQASMIASFNSGNGLDARLMTILTGAAVCIFILAIGISMIVTSSRLKRRTP